MIDILTAAGYSTTSAAGRMSSSHPLFTRTGTDRYRLVGPATDATRTGHYAARTPGEPVLVRCR